MGRLLGVWKHFSHYAHVLLLIPVLVSAFAVVFYSYESRQVFDRLQTLQQEVGGLQTEWRQLLVEEGAFSSSALVDQKAREELKMGAPDVENVVAVRLK